MKKFLWIFPILLLLFVGIAQAETTFIYSMGPETQIYSDTNVGSVFVYTDNIDLSANIYATVEFTFDGDDATDDIEWELYLSYNSSWDGDEITIASFVAYSDGSVDIKTIQIGPHLGLGPGHYRFGMKSSDTTTTFTVVAIYVATKHKSP
jgi:hypothetical protein